MTSPADVTEALMTEFVADMVKRLAAKTLNGRLSKICSIFKVAKGKHLLQVNPAAETLGVKESRVLKRKTRRLPFDEADIQRIFSSDVYTRQARSKGSSREATYWIPLMMFYSGARPEEIAGLALDEIREDPSHGWYFDIVDRPSSSEDDDLFGKSQKKGKDDGRNLKTNASVRRVPIAKELISLGLLEYVAWVRKKYAGAKLLFPTLKKDTHGKFSGAFLKHFGRELRKLGITDPRKVLYSFRHTFKDLLEQAGVDSRYLRRLLGHTTGDGSITDGYGSDLPFDRIVGHFSHVRFPTISMKTWEPGAGFVGHMKCSKTQGECASCAPRSSDMAYEEVGESAV
jgi:integrase